MRVVQSPHFINTPERTKASDCQKNVTDINALPPEILLEILRFLNDGQSLNANMLVNHEWSVLSIDALKHKVFFILTDFATFLADNLKDVYIFQKEALYSIKYNREILNSENLSEIKLSCDKLKNQILFTLKELSDSELKELEANAKEKISNFFNVFKLIEEGRIQHRKTLEKINAQVNSHEKGKKLKEFVTQLLEENEIPMALSITASVSNSKKSFLYKKILEIFFEKSKIINGKISAIFEKNKARGLENEFETLDEKCEKVKEEPDEGEKPEILKGELELLNMGYESWIDQTLKIVEAIPLIHDRWSVFVYLIKKLAEIERFDTIKNQLLNSYSISLFSLQSYFLTRTVIELIEKEKFIHVMKFVKMLSSSDTLENDLERISLNLALRGQSFLAREVMNKLSTEKQASCLERIQEIETELNKKSSEG